MYTTLVTMDTKPVKLCCSGPTEGRTLLPSHTGRWKRPFVLRDLIPLDHTVLLCLCQFLHVSL